MKKHIIFIILFGSLLWTVAANGGQEPKNPGNGAVINAVIRDRDYLIVKGSGLTLYPAPPGNELFLQNPASPKVLAKGMILKITDLKVITNPGDRKLQGVWMAVKQVRVSKKIAGQVTAKQAGAMWENWLKYADYKPIAIAEKTVKAFLDKYPQLFAGYYAWEEVADLLILVEDYFNQWRITPSNLTPDTMENIWQQFLAAYTAGAAPEEGWIAENTLVYK